MERRIFAGFVVALCLLVAMAVAAASGVRSFNRASEHVRHTEEVRRELLVVFSHLQDVETGSRGFLLTGQTEYMEGQERGLEGMDAAWPRLESLVADDPAQQSALVELRRLIEQRISQVRHGNALRRGGEAAAAATFVATGQGKQTMDTIRAAIDAMRRHEDEELAQQLAAAQRTGKWTAVALAAGLAVDFLLLGAVFLVARRGLRARSRAAQEQQRAREYSDSIVDTVREPLVILSSDLLVVRANRSFFETFRLTPAETEGRRFTALDRGAWDVPALTDRLRQVVPAQADFADFELDIEFPSLGRKTMLLNARKLYRPGNHTEQLLLAIEDVTERRRAEEERDRFYTISLDLLCISSAEDGRFRRVCPAVKEILGWTPEEFLAMPYLEQIHPDDRAATQAEVERQVKRGEKVFRFENRFRHKDGSWRILSWRSVPQPGGLMYAIARDVTARRQAEQEIQDLNERLLQRARELEAANHELEAFSYSVSHDLRAPLRHIDGFANLLAKQHGQKLDETGRRHLDVISGAARKLGVLIDELLAFSRMGRSEMRRSPTDMGLVVGEVVAELRGATPDRRIEWQIDSLPIVPADGSMIRQVWRNLLGNAVKYSRERDVARIEVHHRTDPREGHVFSVRDNGAGFDMQYANKLFGVFQRLHTEQEFEGTGVGLATVQRILLRHGGRIWAEARPNEGATFHFTLPAYATGDPDRSASRHPYERLSQSPFAERPPARR